jgi:hypothetical protein
MTNFNAFMQHVTAYSIPASQQLTGAKITLLILKRFEERQTAGRPYVTLGKDSVNGIFKHL